ncbi:MAG: divalent-cation tolerance protein CutA [Janthinobacterium lividum]
MNKTVCVILTTTDDKEIADKIAKKLVENDLAKCVQIDNITSYFQWEGSTSVTSEFRLTIKADAKNYQLIEKDIIENHNYQLPQIIKFDISGGYSRYLQWIEGK